MNHSRCSKCSQPLLTGSEFYSCTGCHSAIHRTCWVEASELCASCNTPIPAIPCFLPLTPVLDIIVYASGGLTVILFLIAALVLSEIPFRSDAPGSSGVAFYFVFLPLTAAILLLLALFALVWFLRSDRRRPRPLDTN